MIVVDETSNLPPPGRPTGQFERGPMLRLAAHAPPRDRGPIVITGMGVLSCNGIGREAYWDALRSGRSGIGPIDRFDASDLPCRIAGQLRDFSPEDFMSKTTVKRWFRHVHQAIASARLAVDDAELDKSGYPGDRVAVAFGTSVGSPNEAYLQQQEVYNESGYQAVNRMSSTAFSAHSAAVNVGIDFGLRGPHITLSSGCATGLDVMSWSVHQMRSGRADAAVMGATESPIFPMSLATAASLGILSSRNDAPERAMRPFDLGRDGIVLSEGAVALVLEYESSARARGAPILAEVLGYGAAAEGRNALVLDRSGEGLARAMQEALDDAGVAPHEIDHVQAHGASMDMYDRCETNALKRVFGRHAYRMPVSGVKSMVGQTYSAGGLFGVGAALLALDEGVVAPTINLEDPDPECDLDYVARHARRNDIETAMAVAISFGGTHTVVVLRRARA